VSKASADGATKNGGATKAGTDGSVAAGGRPSANPPRKRGTRFIPIEDAVAPGMSPRTREVVALAMCGFSLYALLCLATFRLDLHGAIPTEGMANLGGAVGYHLAHGFVRALGYAGWVPFLLLLGGAMALFAGRTIERLVVKALGAVVFAAMMGILFAGYDGQAGVSAVTPYGAGGVFGQVVSPRLDAMFGGTGRLLLVGFGALVAFLLATEWMFSQLLLRVVAALEALWRRVRRLPMPLPVPAIAGGAEVDLEVDAPSPSRRRSKAAVAEEGESDEAGGGAASLRGDPAGDGADGEAVVELPRRRSRRAAAKAAGDVDADGDGEADAEAEVDTPAPKSARSRGRSADEEDVADADPDSDEAEGKAGVEVPSAPAVEPPAPAKPVEPPIVVVRPKPKPPAKPKPKPKKAGQSTLPFDEAYPFPPAELFQEATHTDLGATAEVLSKGGLAIVQKLANFGIESAIETASVGPAVTQYELRVADSVRVNKVVGFESDLAAALKAVSVRVVAPIPGKDTIGIEVPNPQRQKVFMRDLLDQFGRAEDLAIPLFLGKDVAGSPIVEDLARMPHLLIAGTTGSGKSVCINTILLSILMTRTPQQVKLILVDPKMVELQAYKRVPHLCCDVVTNMKKAPSVLQWAVDEMENRYALLSVAGVNHIRNYNRLGQQELAKRMQREPDPDRVQLPYIVIVIDEFADLMNVAQNEVEELIQRLAQKSRAVGMHVILATQRPSSEVITGIIKANLPCQIAFKVNRKIDSRVILDANGAEKLLGFGDMLYMPPGGGAMLRAQGTFVADDEMQAVVKFLEEHGQEPDHIPELVQKQSSSRPGIADRDERYREAVEIVLGQQRGSATLLQRALAVGYTRATRLIELMEEDGLVGPFVDSKSRDVLMTLEEWRAREEQMAAALAEGDAGEAGETEAGESGESGEAGEAADDEAEVAAESDPAGAGDDDDREPMDREGGAEPAQGGDEVSSESAR
jgi:S-DNA-T family DNA segregation ATPase FtsK/SpoIIIE